MQGALVYPFLTFQKSYMSWKCRFIAKKRKKNQKNWNIMKEDWKYSDLPSVFRSKVEEAGHALKHDIHE